MVKSPLKYHGGKSPLAAKIVALLPKSRTFVEPYAGGLSVLLARDPTDSSEVVNDVDSDLTKFWVVLQNQSKFAVFLRLCEATPFSEYEWERAGDVLRDQFLDEDDVQTAHAFFVRCRQSLAGRCRSFSPISTSRLRRGMNEQASAWLSAVEGLPVVHERLKRVVVLNREATDVIRQFDVEDCVIYCDCPYPAETRSSPDVYVHEMTTKQHAELLEVLTTAKHAKFAVSGYRCPQYDDALGGWRLVDWEVPNNAAGGDKKRRMTESLWMNYDSNGRRL